MCVKQITSVVYKLLTTACSCPYKCCSCLCHILILNVIPAILCFLLMFIIVYMFAVEWVLWMLSESVTWTPVFYLRDANVTINVVKTTTDAPTSISFINDIPLVGIIG